MTIWQLINLFLYAVFFGFVCSYIAQRKNRHPVAWFFIGALFSLCGVILIWILPARIIKSKQQTPVLSDRSEAWIKMWYYLDPKTREQKGPMEFPDLANDWRNKVLNDESLIWGEGMKEWRTLSQLPEIVKEMDSTTPVLTKKK